MPCVHTLVNMKKLLNARVHIWGLGLGVVVVVCVGTWPVCI